MATTIITKNGSGAPVAGDLVQGELAVDLTNKEVYTKDSNGAVIKIGSAGDDSGIPEAPEDGKQYAREDATWTEVVSATPTSSLPVVLRSGGVQLPLTVDGAKLAVMTRGGEIELPLAA